MRMAKPFAMRVPLEDCQGNSGTIVTTGDEAHMRYTELKMSEIAKYLYGGLEKNAISEWKDNFDETDKYPGVMPSIGFYNIVNGTIGLGIAISSSIPQFNLKETNENIIKLIKNPELPAAEVINLPDFATGGYLLNEEEVKASLIKGQGASCRIRGKVKYDPNEHALVITELPYSVYTSTLTGEIKALVEANEEYGIDGINDMSGKTVNYTIYLSKKANPSRVLSKLYKDTSLESHFPINMWALDQGRFPKIFGLKDFYLTYIEHIRKCKTNEITFDLNKALDRQNIVKGLLKAIEDIDNIIASIKQSTNGEEAIKVLINNFDFNEAQAKAILAMRLSSLTKLDKNKLNEEEAELEKSISWFNELLNDSKKLDNELIKVLQEVADKFGDERRTIIMNTLDDEEEEEEVEEKIIITYVSSENSIISKEVGDLVLQNKKTTGTKIKFMDKNATLNKTIVSKNTDKLMAFSNIGKVYMLPVKEIPLNEENYLSTILSLSNEEFITNILPINNDNNSHIVFATKQGLVKKTDFSEYSNATRKSGIIAIKIKDDDALIGVNLIKNEKDKILLCTKYGRVLIFDQNEIGATGRQTAGVKGINLDDGDEVVNMQLVNDNIKEFLSVTEKGYCKRNKIKDYIIGTRASKGQKGFYFKDNEDAAIGTFALNDSMEEIIIFSDSSNLKLKISDIPALSSKQGKGSCMFNTKSMKVTGASIIENL